MVETIKFSQMTSGGDIANGNEFPGLLGGANVLFDIPWTFLPPGTTAQRPAPSSTINYRLRFNTDDQLYEYYDAVLGQWTQLQESFFTQGPFVTYTTSVSLPDAFNLGSLTDGLLKQTVSAGISTPAIALLDTDYYGPGMVGYLQSPAGVKDPSGNIVLQFGMAPSGANYLQLGNNVLGSSPYVASLGAGTNIALALLSKGDASISLTTNAITEPTFLIRNGTGAQHQTNFFFANTSNVRNVTFQDSDGTVAWLTDIPAGSPSALTEVDDTNITMVLGGSPSTALLQAVSMTLGWTGTLAVGRGGLGQGATPSDGQIPVGNGGLYTPTAIASGSGILVANGPASISVGLASISTLNLLANLTGGSAAPTAHTLSAIIDTCIGATQGDILYRNSTVWTVLAPGTSGQFLQTQGAAANPQWTTSATVTPAALTKNDDTNVTVTLAGSPNTALLQATSLTLGWTGQLSLTRGGTNNSLTASAGGIVWSDATKLNILAGTATASQILLSGNAATPAWSTTTYPATNAINTIMYASSANVLGVISPVNSAVLISSSGGVPSMSTTLPSGIAATNMNLTTPTLGVASATSINFGGGALSTYIPDTAWTPVVTFATPGDLSVSYASQVGWYTTIGAMTFINFTLTFTPTYTTASGEFRISGLPVTASFRNSYGNIITGSVPFTAGNTHLALSAQSGVSYLIINQCGTTVSASSMSTTNFVTGVQVLVNGSVPIFHN